MCVTLHMYGCVDVICDLCLFGICLCWCLRTPHGLDTCVGEHMVQSWLAPKLYTIAGTTVGSTIGASFILKYFLRDIRTSDISCRFPVWYNRLSSQQVTVKLHLLFVNHFPAQPFASVKMAAHDYSPSSVVSESSCLHPWTASGWMKGQLIRQDSQPQCLPSPNEAERGTGVCSH